MKYVESAHHVFALNSYEWSVYTYVLIKTRERQRCHVRLINVYMHNDLFWRIFGPSCYSQITKLEAWVTSS